MNVNKIFCALLVLILSYNFSFAQYSNSRSTQLEEKRAVIKKQMMDILDFTPKDKIADIGSGNGENIVLISSFYPNLTFTIEDIDSLTCNAQVFSKNIVQNGFNVNIKNFSFKYGNEKSTMLPSHTFSKILMFEILHEFTFKDEMLTDIKRILKKDGIIIIADILVFEKEEKSKEEKFIFSP